MIKSKQSVTIIALVFALIVILVISRSQDVWAEPSVPPTGKTAVSLVVVQGDQPPNSILWRMWSDGTVEWAMGQEGTATWVPFRAK